MPSLLLLLLVLLQVLVPLISAHSFLTKPKPYTTRFHTRHCRGAGCTNACPLEYNTGMANSVDNPEKVWSRGETVPIEWAKNNHDGGFVRLTLVPAGVMNDRAWHDRLTIMHGCWHSGMVSCRGRGECGTDRDGLAFGRQITIPHVFPDGDYVLGFAWYGGVRNGRGFFPDFFSCSHVRIAGGPLGGTHAAYFDAGKGPREYVRDDECYTSSDFVGDCGNRGCVGRRAFWGRPRGFKGTDRSGRLTAEMVETALERGEEGLYEVENREGEQVKGGVCSGRFCCKESCGTCGGPGCVFRRGGKEACCMGNIRRARRKCSKTVRPPCLLH